MHKCISLMICSCFEDEVGEKRVLLETDRKTRREECRKKNEEEYKNAASKKTSASRRYEVLKI